MTSTLKTNKQKFNLCFPHLINHDPCLNGINEADRILFFFTYTHQQCKHEPPKLLNGKIACLNLNHQLDCYDVTSRIDTSQGTDRHAIQLRIPFNLMRHLLWPSLHNGRRGRPLYSAQLYHILLPAIDKHSD